LAERFPDSVRAADDVLPTGLPAIDAVAGGLPRPGLTELVCSAPSCGSQLFFGRLLQLTREQSLRVALVDRDHFDPTSWPVHLLEHLVWVKTRHIDEAIMATDLLARDANLGLLVLDLRQATAVELKRIPSTRWYRLQRALAPTQLAGLVFTPYPLVSSARLRLALTSSHDLAHQKRSRPSLIADLAPGILRQRTTTLATAS
jgi:hypothetical protein